MMNPWPVNPWDKVHPVVQRELLQSSRYILQGEHEIFLMIRLSPGTDKNHFADRLAAEFGAYVHWISLATPYISATVPKDRVVDLAKLPEVEYVYHTPHVESQGETSFLALSGAIDRVTLQQIREALGVPEDAGAEVDVGIIDSGVQREHAGRVARAWSLVDYDPYSDDSGHGTAIVSIVASINPLARLHVVKVFQRNEGDAAHVMQAMELLAVNGIKLVNASFGVEVYEPMDELAEALRRDYGMVMVASAGNNGPGGRVMSPAASPAVVAVGSVALARPAPFQVSTFSARGPSYLGVVKPDFAAFGGSSDECIQTVSGCWKGTSFSAPEVVGLLSLLHGSVEARLQRLVETVGDIAPAGKDNVVGFGVPTYQGQPRFIEAPSAPAPTQLPIDTGVLVAIAAVAAIAAISAQTRTA